MVQATLSKGREPGDDTSACCWIGALFLRAVELLMTAEGKLTASDASPPIPGKLAYTTQDTLSRQRSRT